MPFLISPLLWLCMALSAGGCNPNQDPTGPQPSQALTPTEIAGIRLTYMCGNTFRVRNPNDQEAAVTWDVYQKNETGSLTLPPKPAGALHSETFFTTVNKGTVRLFYNGQLIQTKANGNKPPCQVASDTVRPPVPDQALVLDSTEFMIPSPVEGGVRYWRRLLDIVFKADASGAAVNGFLRNHQAVIVGGVPDEQIYSIRIPDPGPSWDDLQAKLAQMRADSAVDLIALIKADAPLKLKPLEGRYPDDGPGWSRQAWIDDSSFSTWALRAVRAPLAWGCENGLYGATSPEVAIVEWGVDRSHPDLAESVISYYTLPPRSGELQVPQGILDTLEAHGTGVAGMLNAEGDNNQGAAGMMWRTRLRLYAAASPNAREYIEEVRTFRRTVLRQLRLDRPQIVNFSISIEADTLNRAEQTLLVRAFRRFLVESPQSVVVMALGNQSTSYESTQRAALSTGPREGIRAALSQLRNEGFGDRIIFVAGTQRDGTFWPQSNVILNATDLAAPSSLMRLIGVHRAGSVFTRPYIDGFGTSFSAPLVAGVAAQLLAMDPTLGPARVKDYIVRGAQSARVDPASGALIPASAVVGAPGTVHQLDAYGSLSLLSRERQGTPICGFPVTLELPESGPRVRLTRNGTNSETITVNAAPGYQVDGLSVAQGGRLFAVGQVNFEPNTPPTPMEVNEYALANGQWSVRRTIPDVAVRTYLEKDTVDSDNFSTGFGTRWTLRGPTWGSGTTLRLAETTQPYLTPVTTPFYPFRYPYTLTAEFSQDGAFAVVRTRLESPPCPNYQDQMWLVTLPNGPVQASLPTQCEGEGPRDAAWDPSSSRFILAELGANGVTYQARRIISGVAQADGPGITIPDRFPTDYSLGAEGHSTDPSGTTATWLELVQNGCYLTTRTTSTFALVSEQLYPYSNSDWLGFCQVPVQMLRTKPGSVTLRH